MLPIAQGGAVGSHQLHEGHGENLLAFVFSWERQKHRGGEGSMGTARGAAGWAGRGSPRCACHRSAAGRWCRGRGSRGQHRGQHRGQQGCLGTPGGSGCSSHARKRGRERTPKAEGGQRGEAGNPVRTRLCLGQAGFGWCRIRPVSIQPSCRSLLPWVPSLQTGPASAAPSATATAGPLSSPRQPWGRLPGGTGCVACAQCLGFSAPPSS